MRAELLLRERHVLAEDAFVEIIVWRVPQALRGSTHEFKHRLALVIGGVCVLRYDNEAGKGDHRHIGQSEMPHAFGGYDKLISDFWTDVDAWRRKR